MALHKLNPDSWVDSYADYLFNFAVARVSDAEIAKDLVSETFLAGLKSAKNYKGDAAERTWLIAILKRKVIDHYRKINSKKGKAEVRMSYSSSSDADGDWMEEQVADPFSKSENSAISWDALIKIGFKMMISCEKAVHICDKTQYKEATFVEKLKLKFHLFICKTCSTHSARNTQFTSRKRQGLKKHQLILYLQHRNVVEVFLALHHRMLNLLFQTVLATPVQTRNVVLFLLQHPMKPLPSQKNTVIGL